MSIQGNINKAVSVAGLIASNLQSRQQQMEAANKVAAARRESAIIQRQAAEARIKAQSIEAEKKKQEGQAELNKLLFGKKAGV